MPIFQQPPPQPFLGGLQPLAPRELSASLEDVPVNNPPFSHPGRMAAVAASLLISWQPVQPANIQKNRLVQAATATVNNPPVNGSVTPAELSLIVRWFDTAPSAQPRWQYVVQGVQVDNPPINGSITPSELGIVGRWSEPSQPFQNRQRYLAQGVVAQVDNPPVNGAITPAEAVVINRWLEPVQPLQIKRQFFTVGVVAQIDNPPVNSSAAELVVVNRWVEPVTPTRQVYPQLVQVNATTPDNPVFNGGFLTAAEMGQLRYSWETQFVLSIRPKTLITGYIPDNPPFSGGFLTNTEVGLIRQAWETSFVLPTKRQFVVPINAVVNNPPFGSRHDSLWQLYTQWLPPLPVRQKSVYFTVSGVITTAPCINEPTSLEFFTSNATSLEFFTSNASSVEFFSSNLNSLDFLDNCDG